MNICKKKLNDWQHDGPTCVASEYGVLEVCLTAIDICVTGPSVSLIEFTILSVTRQSMSKFIIT